MFNDKFGLTQAVLNGTKTMTRRVVPQSLLDKYDAWYEDFLYKQIGLEEYLSVEEYVLNLTAYNIGEIVAIAQSYHTLNKSGYTAPEWLDHVCESSAGYENKMFVRAELMPPTTSKLPMLRWNACRIYQTMILCERVFGNFITTMNCSMFPKI